MSRSDFRPIRECLFGIPPPGLLGTTKLCFDAWQGGVICLDGDPIAVRRLNSVATLHRAVIRRGMTTTRELLLTRLLRVAYHRDHAHDLIEDVVLGSLTCFCPKAPNAVPNGHRGYANERTPPAPHDSILYVSIAGSLGMHPDQYCPTRKVLNAPSIASQQADPPTHSRSMQASPRRSRPPSPP